MVSPARKTDRATPRPPEPEPPPLYAPRTRVYPRAVSGKWRHIKWATLVLLLGLYYVVPWLRWDRGPGAPSQAILIDLDHRRGWFFDIVIWPQEVYFVTGFLILGAFGLFFASSLFGRVWCGFTCPQTVWTDLFMWVERLIEGDRNERMRLDRQPMSVGKAARKTLKHAAWLMIAAATGGAWVFYYVDAPTTLVKIFRGEASMEVYAFIGLFTATTYVLAGWAREQVCTYMCPWPRFQAAMLDEQSLIVTYQKWRGEPRGKHKAGDSWAGRGDCVDCNLCVAVCPTGIDIRDGQQIECIGCGLCIDACDDVMERIGRPKRLIAYDSERNQELRSAGAAPVYRIFRPRTLLYVAILAAVGLIMLSALLLRSTVDINILPDRNPLFVTMTDGSIRNGYTVRVMNKQHATKSYELGTSHGSARLAVQGVEGAGETVSLAAPPDGVATYHVFVLLPRSEVPGERNDLELTLKDLDSGSVTTYGTIFRGPKR